MTLTKITARSGTTCLGTLYDQAFTTHLFHRCINKDIKVLCELDISSAISDKLHFFYDLQLDLDKNIWNKVVLY